jgi:hypothetical protein
MRPGVIHFQSDKQLSRTCPNHGALLHLTLRHSPTVEDITPIAYSTTRTITKLDIRLLSSRSIKDRCTIK